MTSVVVGVAGGSGSGKTTVVRRLVEALGATHTSVVEHDRYYRDHSADPLEARAVLNYDHPDALDTALLVEHVRTLRAGAPADVPVYDFTRHVRRAHRETIPPRPLIILEGILVLADPALRALMDVKVFVDTDDETRFQRRLQRDTAERGRSPASVIDQYAATVRPMHVEFVEPTRRHADLVIVEGGHNHLAIAELLALIRTRMSATPARVRPRAGDR